MEDEGKLGSYILLSKAFHFKYYYSLYSWVVKHNIVILVDNMNSYARYRIGFLIHRLELMNQRRSRSRENIQSTFTSHQIEGTFLFIQSRSIRGPYWRMPRTSRSISSGIFFYFLFPLFRFSFFFNSHHRVGLAVKPFFALEGQSPLETYQKGRRKRIQALWFLIQSAPIPEPVTGTSSSVRGGG